MPKNKFHKLELVIFDLDGVIVSTDIYHFQAWKSLFQEHFNILLDDQDLDLIRGVARRTCFLKLLTKYHLECPEDKINLYLKAKNDIYVSLLKNLSPAQIKPNWLKLYDFLKRHQVKMAIGSASKNALAILERLEIDHYFNYIVDASKITNPKPDPELFLQAATLAGIKNLENCLVIEDAEVGLQAAKAAKMQAIGYGSAKDLKSFDFTTNNHKDIIKWLIWKYFTLPS